MNINTNTGTFAKTSAAGPHALGIFNAGEVQTPALYIAARAINLVAFNAFMARADVGVASVIIFSDLGLVVKSSLVADWVQTKVEGGNVNGEGITASVAIPSEDIGGSTFAGDKTLAPLTLGLGGARDIAPDGSMNVVDFADLLLQSGYTTVDIVGANVTIS